MGLTAHRMKAFLENASPPYSYEQYQERAHRAADAVAAYHLTHGKNLVAGHFWYGDCLRLLNRNVHRMTVVREPVSRFLSHYRYLAWKYGLEENFSDFLCSDKAKQLGSIYGFYFANEYPNGAEDVDRVVQHAIDSLKEFSIIGDVKDLPGFLTAAKKLIGGPLISFRSNRTPNSVKPDVQQQISEEDQARLYEITSVDRLIYEAVKKMPSYVNYSCSADKAQSVMESST